MARCIPHAPLFLADKGAEREVWTALSQQLPDEAILFHSVQFLLNRKQCEADLVVLWPGVGIAVIEVKGGRVSFADGTWFQSDHAGQHQIESPVDQASRCRHALLEYIKTHSSAPVRSRIVHMVATPYSSFPASFELPGAPRGLLIDEGDLDDIAGRVRTAIETHGAGNQPLDDDETSKIVRLCSPELRHDGDVRHELRQHMALLAERGFEQERFAAMLRQFPSLRFQGGPGTGKTSLALAVAQRLVNEGKRVALVCYSRGLARDLERMTSQWRNPPAYVGEFHNLALLWGHEHPAAPEGSEYYEDDLPAALASMASELPEKDRFDAMVVDEAQDFSDLWWPAAMACLKSSNGDGLFVFHDNEQRVFAREGQIPVPGPAIELRDNFRNTKKIAAVFGGLGEQMRYCGMEGAKVTFVACTEDDAIAVADDQVDKLIDEGWPDGDIAVLTTRSRHPVHADLVERRGFDGYWSTYFDDEVFYTHVLSFKGLERPAVILAVNGFKEPDRARDMLYVALSRAQLRLVICGPEELLSKVGGEGLANRLSKDVERR